MSRAKTLRRNATQAEQKLWAILRNRGLNAFKFRRQQPLGPYFVDFICFDRRLIVEVDGGQYTPRVDAARTQWLEAQGFRIIRFWNNDVLANPEGVASILLEALNSPSPARSRATSPARGEVNSRVMSLSCP